VQQVEAGSMKIIVEVEVVIDKTIFIVQVEGWIYENNAC